MSWLCHVLKVYKRFESAEKTKYVLNRNCVKAKEKQRRGWNKDRERERGKGKRRGKNEAITTVCTDAMAWRCLAIKIPNKYFFSIYFVFNWTNFLSRLIHWTICFLIRKPTAPTFLTLRKRTPSRGMSRFLNRQKSDNFNSKSSESYKIVQNHEVSYKNLCN